MLLESCHESRCTSDDHRLAARIPTSRLLLLLNIVYVIEVEHLEVRSVPDRIS